ncbi:hypothetical protein JCM13210_21800 [Thermaerobacter litoralis]
MSLVVTVAVLAAVALLGRSILRARPRLEAMRRQREWEANRQADREAARRVLERPPEQWPLLDRLPEGVPDRPAYYAARCTLLQERPEGGYASRARGWLVVGRDSLFFHPEEAGDAGRAAAGDAALDIPYTAIERVDSPYVNVLEVIEQDPVTRVWVTHAFRLNRPLVVAAYLSRLAHFELILS